MKHFKKNKEKVYVENDPRKSESEMNDVVLTIKVLTFTDYNMSK